MNIITNSKILLFLPVHQQMALRGYQKEEFDATIETITKLVNAVPDSDAPDFVDESGGIAYLHYFYAGCDWWIKDYSTHDRCFFGYAVINGDTEMAEYGYMDMDELLNDGRIELDFYWTPKNIVEAVNERYPNQLKSDTDEDNAG